MVWRLDFSTCPASPLARSRRSSASLSQILIQARPLGLSRLKPKALTFSFELKKKNGESIAVEYKAKREEVEWVEEEKEVKGVVMTDGCSIMSFAVSRFLFFSPSRS